MAYTPLVFISDAAAYQAAFAAAAAAAYALPSDTYPTTRGGLTFGVQGTVGVRNVPLGAGPLLSAQFNSNTSSTAIILDTPNGGGTYNLKMALGIGNVSSDMSVRILDASDDSEIYVVPIGTKTNGNVVGITGLNEPASEYPDDAASVQLTLPAQIKIVKGATTQLYIASLLIEPVVQPLQDTVLSQEDGTGVHGGTIHPKEPEGKRIGALSAPNGLFNWTLVSPQTYFTVVQENGLSYLATTGTRIPDNWTDDVIVRQVSGDLTRDTTFTLTAGAVHRPVAGILGAISTETWLARKAIKDVFDAEKWSGYQGEPFASDVAVNSITALDAAIHAITPDGTSWHRIRVQDGDWTGTVAGNNTTHKDFGNGGLLIEPDDGHDPLFEFVYNSFFVRKCHLRGFRSWVPVSGAGSYVISNGIPPSAPYPLLKVTDARIGQGFSPTYDITEATDWGTFLRAEFAEQIHLDDCDIDGVGNVLSVSGGRLVSADGNDIKRMVRDYLAVSTAYRLDTPRGIFSDDEMYVSDLGTVIRANPDVVTGLPGNLTPHGDRIQIRRGAENSYRYQTHPNGNANARWTVGDRASNDGNIYQVVSVQAGPGGEEAGVGDDTGPSGTGTGIVVGGVTFDFLQVNTLRTKLHYWCENSASLAQGQSINGDGNFTPNIQVFINSDNGVTAEPDLVYINTIHASGNNRGITGDILSTVHAEFNTFVAGGETALASDQHRLQGDVVRSRRNIVGVLDGAARIEGTFSRYSEGDVGIDWTGGSVSGRLPADFLAGPFAIDPAHNGWGYVVPDLPETGLAEFVSELSKRLHSLDGSVGGRLTETHLITVEDNDGGETVVSLTIGEQAT